MPQQTTTSPRLKPVQRIKFDRWLWDHDIDNVEAGELLDSHPVTVGRWRKRFDDPDRRVPPTQKIREIEALSGGIVTLEDWYRPCAAIYADGPPSRRESGL